MSIDGGRVPLPTATPPAAASQPPSQPKPPATNEIPDKSVVEYFDCGSMSGYS
jgi:hypothetical protein